MKPFCDFEKVTKVLLGCERSSTHDSRTSKIRVYDGLWEQRERKKTENDGSGINMEGQEL